MPFVLRRFSGIDVSVFREEVNADEELISFGPHKRCGLIGTNVGWGSNPVLTWRFDFTTLRKSLLVAIDYPSLTVLDGTR